MSQIDKGVRATNFIIDYGLLIVVWNIIVVIFRDVYISYLIFYLMVFLYYFLFEVLQGQTLGKMVTKTAVVRLDGKTPTIFNLLLRTFSRLVPVDIWSYLLGTERGFHDVFSATKLVEYKKGKKEHKVSDHLLT